MTAVTMTEIKSLSVFCIQRMKATERDGEKELMFHHNPLELFSHMPMKTLRGEVDRRRISLKQPFRQFSVQNSWFLCGQEDTDITDTTCRTKVR